MGKMHLFVTAYINIRPLVKQKISLVLPGKRFKKLSWLC